MTRWPLSVRLGATATAVVALGSAVLSWDALSWGAGQLGVDGRLTWLFPVVIDGVIAVGTITALALRGAELRVRLYVWVLLVGAVCASVVGNAAHAAAGSPVHVAGAALPAVALAASLHLLVILVRHVGPMAEAASTAADVDQDTDQDVSETVTTGDTEQATTGAGRPKVPAKIRVERLVRRHGQDISADVVAARIGVSRRHAARLLADVRRPRVVER